MSRLLIALILLPFPAFAETPRVVTDIPPVHALVASVMQGVGAPEVLVPPGATPHDYALRPSQARALDRADIVIWIGPALTPWLGRAVASLGGGAHIVGLLDAPGVKTLHYRDGAHADERGHQDGADDAHREEGGHGHRHDHDHGQGLDPHAWLDPANAKVWLALIADALAEADPANAAAYRRNADRAVAGLVETESRAEGLIGPARAGSFVLYHDAFRYFQAAFSVEPLAVIADGDAVRPGAARLSKVRRLLEAHPGACVFLEPQIPARAVEAVIEGTGAKLAVLDPLGAVAEPGPGLYGAVITGIAQAMHDCLVE